MSQDRVELIRQHLSAAFSPSELDIVDDSHKHVGHAAAGGGGHFAVTVVADAFKGKSLIERHRLVYAALEAAMKQEIHALSIKAYSPDEIAS